MRTLASFAALALCSGCATTLSTLTTAETLKPGDMQIAVGTGYYVNLGTLVDLASAAYDEAEALKKAVDSGQHPAPTDAQKSSLMEAGLGLALTPPAVMFEATFRYGLADGFDMGLRYGGSNWRLDAKWRFVNAKLGAAKLAVALAPGASRYSFSSALLDLLEYVKIDDFSRWDLEVPLIASLSIGDVFKTYAAARVGYSRYSLDEKLLEIQTLAEAAAKAPLVLETNKGTILHYGGTLGIALGYKVVYLFVELGVHYADFKTTLLGKKLDLGGIVIYPAGGLAVSF